MFLPLSKAILETIIYADIFDYPLTKRELGKWLIGVRIKKQELSLPACLPTGTASKAGIKNLKNIQEQDGLYFLKGRNEIIARRKEREKYSQEKLKIAGEIAGILKLIPTVKLVGITGALAVDNAKEDDDIDLFIITSAGLLWTTRLLVTLLVEMTGRRRHPGQTHVNNKICLNMFADMSHLAVPRKEQDLFSAHEVLQMKLLWERENTYKKFLVANKWVKKYLPNAVRIAVKTPRGWQAESHDSPEVEGSRECFSSLLERFLKSFQLWYMRNRRTTEVIKEGIIRFHPQDAREWVMKEYKKRLRLLTTI